MKGIILGAGFTGLAAGIKTGFPIFEASDHAGGICQSYMKDGFEFSMGGPHWIFGKGVGLDYIKSLVEVKEYERKAGIYYNHIFPYPIQTTAQKKIETTEGSFKDWLSKKFSIPECNLFFNPFNEKYTAGLYDEVIQYDEFKSPPAGSQGFISTFGDPVGGLSNVVAKMAEKCKITYNKRATKVHPINKKVFFDDGSVEEYDKLISTIPLNSLLTACGKKDFDLPYTSVLVINIGAEKLPTTPKEHWLYIPFCKTGFYRLGIYTNVLPSKAPAGMVSFSVEMAVRDTKLEELDMGVICDEVVSELQLWGFIGKVAVIDPTWVDCGYTWLRSKRDRDDHLDWLLRRDIISTGRYGSWKFCGLVDSIQMGLEVSI